MADHRQATAGPGSRARRRAAQITIDQVREIFLAAGGTPIIYQPRETIFRQGEAADWIFFILSGDVQISVISKQGKEGLIALPLSAGEFFGESCLTSQRQYLGSAESLTACDAIKLSRATMSELIKSNAIVGQVFTAYLLQHTLNVEAELIDHLFNSSEKRLARVLLLLANFGHEGRLEPIRNMTQELLAQRVGTTRARISFFMNKFRRLGLIDYNGTIEVHSGLLNVVLDDSRLEDEKE